MILLDTDSFTLHQYGQQRFLERLQAASEIPAITVVTQQLVPTTFVEQLPVSLGCSINIGALSNMVDNLSFISKIPV